MLFDLRNKKQFVILLGVLGMTLAALLSLRLVRFDNNVEVMLPQKPDLIKAFHFLQEGSFASKVLISFERKGNEATVMDLKAAVDQFSSALDSPRVNRIVKGLDAAGSLEDLKVFAAMAPQLLDETALQAIEKKLEPDFVREKLGRGYRAALAPGGSWMAGRFQQDPLGFLDPVMMNLQRLAAPAEIQIRDGYLMTEDARHALVILETNVPVTDGFEARNLIDELNALLESLPAGISARIVAGHLHTLSNEAVLKRDIAVTVTAASVAFLVIFGFLFRDVRALILFGIPAISVLFSVHICSWIAGRLSYMIMGMGAVISGIAVDYCIHVYVAMKSGQNRREAVGEVARPVLMGALTTIGVFSVFLFSRVPGYRELALFTIVSIVLSLLLALWLLPYFLGSDNRMIASPKRSFASGQAPSNRFCVAAWAVFMLFCLALLPFVRFETDVRQYDGSESRIFENEEAFQQIWGIHEKPATLVIEAPELEQALEMEQTIAPQVEQVTGNNTYRRLSAILPTEFQRMQNAAAWNRFWKEGRQEKLKTLLETAGETFAFAPEAFNPFFETLYLGPESVNDFPNLKFLESIRERFVQQGPNGIQLLSYFPDRAEWVAPLQQLTQEWPQVFVVSAGHFARTLSSAILSEAFYLALAIALMIPVLAFLFLKDWRMTFLALIPVVSSVLSIFGMLTLFRLPLNAISLIALLVIGGLSIDYGIFMVYHRRHQLKTNTRMAVTLSALTTLAGAGALAVARHPVLFSYGTTMIVGVLAGYLAALFVIPALDRVTVPRDFAAAA